jgi:hypothetical protein
MAARTDLNGIKTAIKALFDAANTTTASPIDLSSNVAKRVQKVLTVHPEFIRPQASFFPFVTCYVDEKQIDADQIAGNQLNANRMSDLTINIVGAVFNANLNTVTDDPADTDINYLMENIELVLRSSPNLSGTVKWQRPTGINYFSNQDLKGHIRYGVLSLTAKVNY